MSNEIYWLLEVTILPGKLDDFKAVARDLIAATTPEPGTRSYEWAFNESNTVCHIFERYADSDALVKHVASFGNYAARFLAACKVTRFDVYGVPTPAAREALADIQPTYYTVFGGFNR
jgi:quinol monooxygenase YgiN